MARVLDIEENGLAADVDKMLTAVNEEIAVHSSLSSTNDLLSDLPTTNATVEILSTNVSETFAGAGAGIYLCLNPVDSAPS